DETVEWRKVRVARQVGSESVIAEGVAPGETVVTDGQLRLAPGVRVEARAAPEPEGENPAAAGAPTGGGGPTRAPAAPGLAPAPPTAGGSPSPGSASAPAAGSAPGPATSPPAGAGAGG